MDLVDFNATVDAMFASTITQQASLDSLANRALTNGIDLYMNKRYDQAAKEFQRAVGLSPQGQYASDASNYLANAYLKMNKTEKAIDAYEQSIRLNPYRDDTHVTLGNLYFSLDRYKDAEGQYKEAVKKNPSPVNHYSLGQAYLALEEYNNAEREFNIVKRMAPEKANGDYGIGLALAGQERYEDAINRFESALKRDRNFLDAHAEIGYAYADMGDIEKAQEKADSLTKESPGLADTLSKYIYKVDPPKFSFAYSANFLYSSPMNTKVATLDAYLANANASKSFTMKFVFDKEMDRDSVENQFNWQIGKSTGSGPGEAYNLGLALADTEIDLSTHPDHVYYDSDALTAVVTFTIKQNETADGTIDPSHIEFSFSGKDQYGYKMDPEKDQYTGFSGIA